MSKLISEMSDVYIAMRTTDYEMLKERVKSLGESFIADDILGAIVDHWYGGYCMMCFDYFVWDDDNKTAQYMQNFLDEIGHYDLVRLGCDIVDDIEIHYHTGRQLLFVETCVNFNMEGLK